MNHSQQRKKLKIIRPILSCIFLILFLTIPAQAYIGPGAGFAFLSSFLVLFITFFLAVFSFIAWPFRFFFRLIRGQKAYKKGKVNRIVIVGLDGMRTSVGGIWIGWWG